MKRTTKYKGPINGNALDKSALMVLGPNWLNVIKIQIQVKLLMKRAVQSTKRKKLAVQWKNLHSWSLAPNGQIQIQLTLHIQIQIHLQTQA